MMDLWSADENAAFPDAFNPFDFAAAVWPPPPQPSHLQIHQKQQRPHPAPETLRKDGLLEKKLQSLIDGSEESWTYAIFWECEGDENSGQLLGWGGGYYKGDHFINAPRTTPSTAQNPAEQEHRKAVLRDILACGTCSAGNDAVESDLADMEWFFLISMTQYFSFGVDLPGEAFLGSNPIWASGSDRLFGSRWERCHCGAYLGFQTIVCFPTGTGVLELGSTDLIFHTSLLTNNARVLFNFGSGDACLPSAAAPPHTDEGENDPTALWTNDPSSSAAADGISNAKSAGRESAVPIGSID